LKVRTPRNLVRVSGEGPFPCEVPSDFFDNTSLVFVWSYCTMDTAENMSQSEAIGDNGLH